MCPNDSSIGCTMPAYTTNDDPRTTFVLFYAKVKYVPILCMGKMLKNRFLRMY